MTTDGLGAEGDGAGTEGMGEGKAVDCGVENWEGEGGGIPN